MMHKADEILTELQGSEYYSIGDMRSGFWQINVAPEDTGIEKTACITPKGTSIHTHMARRVSILYSFIYLVLTQQPLQKDMCCGARIYVGYTREKTEKSVRGEESK